MVDSKMGLSCVIGGVDCAEVHRGQVGFALFGPYQTFDPGRYSVLFGLGSVEDTSGNGEARVCRIEVVDSTLKLIAQHTVYTHDLVKPRGWYPLDFELLSRERLEFRVYSFGECDFFVDEYRPVIEPPERRNQFQDHSQNGEVRLLIQHMLASAVKNTILVDVGAYGKSGSNSYDLMRHFGWTGILVEPNPTRCQRIERDFVGLRFTLENVAVSDRDDSGFLYLGRHDEISSLHKGLTASYGDVHGQIAVRIVRLPGLLEKHGIPKDFGLLSVDAEGEDVKILNDVIGEGFRPSWIVFEGALNFESLQNLELSLEFQDSYEVVAKRPPNLILRRRLPS